MAHIAVILSGCGYLDGAEIHESVLALLALSQAGHTYQCFAPDVQQAKVVDHLTGKEKVGEKRNVLREAARIARGKIKALSDLEAKAFDAVMIPGGFGVALNLSDFAAHQDKCRVDPDLKRVVLEFFHARKPIGATCITPAILAKIFEGVKSVTLTLGSDPTWAEYLTKLGMKAELGNVRDLISDEKHRIYTTPCYMEPEDLAGLYDGIQKVVSKLG